MFKDILDNINLLHYLRYGS